jgi:hypothetical protein
VGEVFSSIAKSLSSRAAPHLEIAQMLKATSSNQVKSTRKRR